MLGGETSELDLDTPVDGLRWGMLGFLFCFASCAAIALVERIFLGFLTRLQWVANRQVAPLKADKWFTTVEKYFGWFLISLGFGLAVSAVWSRVHLFWFALPYVGSGLGLVLGARIGRRILKLSEE